MTVETERGGRHNLPGSLPFYFCLGPRLLCGVSHTQGRALPSVNPPWNSPQKLSSVYHTNLQELLNSVTSSQESKDVPPGLQSHGDSHLTANAAHNLIKTVGGATDHNFKIYFKYSLKIYNFKIYKLILRVIYYYYEISNLNSLNT